MGQQAERESLKLLCGLVQCAVCSVHPTNQNWDCESAQVRSKSLQPPIFDFYHTLKTFALSFQVLFYKF